MNKTKELTLEIPLWDIEIHHVGGTKWLNEHWTSSVNLQDIEKPQELKDLILMLLLIAER